MKNKMSDDSAKEAAENASQPVKIVLEERRIYQPQKQTLFRELYSYLIGSDTDQGKLIYLINLL
jgi:hypothetical protein